MAVECAAVARKGAGCSSSLLGSLHGGWALKPQGSLVPDCTCCASVTGTTPGSRRATSVGTHVHNRHEALYAGRQAHTHTFCIVQAAL